MDTTLHKGYTTPDPYLSSLGYYDDLRFPITSISLSGAQPPTATAYKGGMVLSFPTNLNKTIYFTAQLPHGAIQGRNLDIHYHMVIPTSGAGLGVENIKMDLTYSWAGIGGVFPSETTLSKTYDVQNVIADTHTLVDIGDLLYSNRGAGSNGVSDCILCSLTRDVSVANDYASSLYLVTTDFHIRCNSLGSREEYIK